MPIGSGPDIPTHDKEREEEVRLGDIVQEWWYGLDESEKVDIIETIYPDQAGLIDSDELWQRTEWKDQLDAYLEEHGENGVVV
jgi:hypothetical protein